MERLRFAASLAVAAALALLVPLAAGAQSTSQRIHGTIAALDGDVLTVDEGTGTAKISLDPKVRVLLVEPARLDQIRPGDFVGSGAVPQPDGTQRAVEVHIFAESLRGEGEGFRPWTGRPNGTMTNATVREVEGTGATSAGRTLTLTYPGGQQHLVVPSDAPIVRFTSGTRADLVKGAHVAINAARAADGTLSAKFLNVGKNGFTPPS